MLETEIGEINHALLGEAFAGISEKFDLLDKFTRSTLGVRLSQRYVEQLLEYDGPPAAALVEDYRREWVDEHLRNQAQAYETDDGRRGVDFGLVTQQVDPDELQRRLETYLRADDSTDTIDEVRVRAEDGTELRGTLSGDDVEWDQIT